MMMIMMMIKNFFRYKRQGFTLKTSFWLAMNKL